MCQADPKEAKDGDESIDRNKHDKQVAQAGGDIVPLVIREMFPPAVDHSQ